MATVSTPAGAAGCPPAAPRTPKKLTVLLDRVHAVVRVGGRAHDVLVCVVINSGVKGV